jgi:hypothetical protein
MRVSCTETEKIARKIPTKSVHETEREHSAARLTYRTTYHHDKSTAKMSLRNFVPSYPQLSVNAPPPHHQTHRVQALPVSVATALQQQISQQQQQQSQQNASAQSNPNGGGAGNVQAQSHEYHVAPCLQFQAPAGANIAPNFIRHMSSKSQSVVVCCCCSSFFFLF